MSRSRDPHQPTAGLLGGPVEDRPRLSPEPVRALMQRLRRSATRATAIAGTLDGDDGAWLAAAQMRDVAAALDDQIATLGQVLAYLTTSPPDPPEVRPE
jgi:hypothetical protein